jgi:MerR family transcriptional regulator, light-induced transcriptional regulator
MRPYLTSKEIGEVLGVSPATIRRWADAGLLPSERTAGGHRRFSMAVAERLAHQPREGDSSLDAWIRLLVTAGPGLDVDAALLAERSRRSSWHAVADELGNVLRELGVRWQRQELTVVDEHLASERLARALSRAADGLPAREGGPLALLAAAEREAHTLGLRLVELCLRERGWRTLWIGRDLPNDLLARAVAERRPAALAVSASICRERPELEAESAALSSACARAGTALVVGGSGPWPEQLPHGAVVRSFQALSSWLTSADEALRVP